MDFNKMKVGKKGSGSIAGSMTELMIAIIIIAVFSFIVITMIIVFAPLVQDKAEEAKVSAEAENNSAVASLWAIFATEGLFEILAVSAYLLIVVIVLVAIIVKTTKQISK